VPVKASDESISMSKSIVNYVVDGMLDSVDNNNAAIVSSTESAEVQSTKVISNDKIESGVSESETESKFFAFEFTPTASNMATPSNILSPNPSQISSDGSVVEISEIPKSKLFH
jgi:hypothetical protein